MTRRSSSLVACAASVIALASPAASYAQSPVEWSATSPASTVARGSTVRVVLKAVIAPGWHIYSLTQPPGGPIALRISVPAGQALTSAGSAEGPLPELANDPSFGMQVETYSQSAEFTVPLVATPTASPGKTTVDIAARYQACNATLCMPPRTAHVPVSVTVTARKTPRRGKSST